MSPLLPHLVVLPIVLPLVAAALMLLLGDRRRRFKCDRQHRRDGCGLLVALRDPRRVDAGGGAGAIGVYLLELEAPFGIVLVADRLSALMLVLTGVVGLAAAVYATAALDRAGVAFHPLFQIQLMGLNGAFLTGDLFNLFVFFEVMLAASYGLLLHGSGGARVRSGLHYIAVNLLASSLFLVGLAMIYGVMGTLSMADIAAKLPLVRDRRIAALLHAGAAILAVAFLMKAAIWPLNFWLVPAYTAASAPVAALFAIHDQGGHLHAAAPVEPVFLRGCRALGELRGVGLPLRRARDRRLRRHSASWRRCASGASRASRSSCRRERSCRRSGSDVASVTSTALFYLLSSTLAASALFLLVELVERAGVSTAAARRLPDAGRGERARTPISTTRRRRSSVASSRFRWRLLGLAFIACALLVAGLPPLSGFVAKVALMAALVSYAELGLASAPRDGDLVALRTSAHLGAGRDRLHDENGHSTLLVRRPAAQRPM